MLGRGYKLLGIKWGLGFISMWYFEVALWLAGALRHLIWLAKSAMEQASVWKHSLAIM